MQCPQTLSSISWISPAKNLKNLGKAIENYPNQQLKSDSPELSLIQQQAKFLAKPMPRWITQWFFPLEQDKMRA